MPVYSVYQINYTQHIVLNNKGQNVPYFYAHIFKFEHIICVGELNVKNN